MKIRPAFKWEYYFLERMVFEAFFWSLNHPRPEFKTFRKRPEFKTIVENWGRHGDRAIVATQRLRHTGAAWFRLWTDENHSYGYVDSTIPELGIAVAKPYRYRGIGRLLLRQIVDVAQSDGYPAISLSVDPRNFARNLYESEGFVKVGESGTSWTLLHKF